MRELTLAALWPGKVSVVNIIKRRESRVAFGPDRVLGQHEISVARQDANVISGLGTDAPNILDDHAQLRRDPVAERGDPRSLRIGEAHTM